MEPCRSCRDPQKKQTLESCPLHRPTRLITRTRLLNPGIAIDPVRLFAIPLKSADQSTCLNPVPLTHINAIAISFNAYTCIHASSPRDRYRQLRNLATFKRTKTHRHSTCNPFYPATSRCYSSASLTQSLGSSLPLNPHYFAFPPSKLPAPSPPGSQLAFSSSLFIIPQRQSFLS